ncbi:CrcB-like protein-domain-containing protein [Lipomyces kononenkoae]|uniref:CrcB-like protein-domain-containing protein n=1 Tax=Lipomyces kononenkoae TaxID=34357 RepID=A0ACC3SZ54_LIPKO
MVDARRSIDTASRGITEVFASDSIADDLTNVDIETDQVAADRRTLEGEIAEDSRLGTSTFTRGVHEVEAPVELGPDDKPGTLERRLSQASARDVIERQERMGEELPSKKPWYYVYSYDTIEVVLWLIFFSLLGVLARLGIIALESYPGASVDGLVWVQFVGCVVMGFLAESKNFFNVSDGRNLQIFVGLSTGFCGSLTTFSSWMQATFLALANASPSYERPRGYSVLGLFDGIIVTLCLSVAGITTGAHVGLFTRTLWRRLAHKYSSEFIERDKDNELSPIRTRYGFQMVSGLCTIPLLKLLSLVLGLGCWVGAVLMAIFISKWRGNVLFALVFGPLGTLTRWLLSRHMNPLHPSFPFGTFTANILGTVLMGIFAILQQRVDSKTGCQVLQGMMAGYCGCLTTVSTFALELRTLQRSHAWRYGTTSVVVGVVAMCLTMGVDNWRFRAFVQRTC